MIVTRLKGGLGNQMFQFAAGKSLAVKFKTDLFLDLSFYEMYSNAATHTFRKFALDVFNHSAMIASKEILDSFGKWNSNVLFKGISQITGHKNIFREPHFYYSPLFERIKNDTLIDGYWQSEKYFSDINDEMKNEFSFKNAPAGQNEIIGREIQSCNSVSIHIRRGDYILNPDIRKVHPVCSVDYYLKAMEIIHQRITSPAFYVFSDDMEWVKNNLVFNDMVTFIDWNSGEKSYEDLRLMSLCRHHIIANSSFSWWGAWLGSYQDTISIAPVNWFHDGTINTNDLYCDKWMKI